MSTDTHMSNKSSGFERMMLQQLESLHRAGIRQIKHVAATAAAAPSACAAPKLAPKTLPSSRDADPVVNGLEVLRREVAICKLCSVLVQNRTQTVFGVGNPHARLVFFGEAPGADEDRLGEPFVGRAGQLLTDIITKGCKLRREDVYIMNVLKCRPPDNRTPIPDEVEHCRQFFERQLELIRPEFVCCLGACAAQALLQTTQSVGKLRGRLHAVRGMQVICTYHPAYLLRNPEAKKPVWEDMKLLMRAMGTPVD